MIGASNAKKSVIWHAIAPTYGATTVIIMDMLPWIAQIQYCHQAHQLAVQLTTMIGVGDLPLDITVTPDTPTITSETDPDSVTLNPNPVTTAIEVVATRTPAEVTPDHSTDLPTTTFHVTEAPVPTATIMIHLITNPHLKDTPLEMTADPAIGPGNHIINQTKDLHPLHEHHLGNTRTKDTKKSQLMTHHWNTTAQMIMTVTLMMI